MGPYYIPPSAIDGTTQYHCSWYAPGASGGVNIDGGAAVDPETGMMYVGIAVRTEHDGSRQGSVLRAPLHAGRRRRPAQQLRQARRAGAAAGLRACRRAVAARGGGGGAGGGGGGAARRSRRRHRRASYKDASPGTSAIAGISILKPRELGGITAYNMNSGDKAWWIPNGGQMVVADAEAELARTRRSSPDVTLPPQPAGRGQPQVITTKTLVIYGTGRSGGPPADANGMFRIYAVDKATGKEVGAVPIPDTDERGADDVHAQRPAVHRVRDRPGREHRARRAGAAEVELAAPKRVMIHRAKAGYFFTYFFSARGPTSAPKMLPAWSTATPSAALVLGGLVAGSGMKD